MNYLNTPATALRLSVAISAAFTAMSPVSGEVREGAAEIKKQDVRWDAPEASPPSFQSISVLNGSTATTIESIAPDPWQELEALREDWDANGAHSISRDAIDHARCFLESLSSIDTPFTPFAYPDGSVGLESHKNRNAAYILVSSADRFTYVLRIGDAVHRGDDVEASKMRELLALLY